LAWNHGPFKNYCVHFLHMQYVGPSYAANGVTLFTVDCCPAKNMEGGQRGEAAYMIGP
jgi:hypothetical protein